MDIVSTAFEPTINVLTGVPELKAVSDIHGFRICLNKVPLNFLPYSMKRIWEDIDFFQHDIQNFCELGNNT